MRLVYIGKRKFNTEAIVLTHTIIYGLMAGIKRKGSAEGRRGKVKRTKLEGPSAPKTPKKHAKKAVELNETDIADDIFDGFADKD